MQNLLRNPEAQPIHQDPKKLDNLSPEKFGKAAYVELTYTPSKLNDSVLYREVTTMKKMEDSNSRLREYESENQVLHDKITQMRQERDGIEESLNVQIQMYKKFLAESESKSEARIKEAQAQFKEKMACFILEKEEEAKYAQSERQLLQLKIKELEDENEELREKLSHSGSQHEDVKGEKELLQSKCQHFESKLEMLTKQKQQSQITSQSKIDELNRKIFESQIEWKSKLSSQAQENEKSMHNLQKQHRQLLQKIDQQRSQEFSLKNNEFQEITKAFEAETKRLNDKISQKQIQISELAELLSEEKSNLLNLSKSYEKQISSLAHEKSRYCFELDAARAEIDNLVISLSDHRSAFESERDRLSQLIASLQKQLQVRYGSQYELTLAMKHRSDNSFEMVNQIANLKQLLIESSAELDNCKREFVAMGKQRDILLQKLEDLGFANEVFAKIKQLRDAQMICSRKKRCHY